MLLLQVFFSKPCFPFFAFSKMLIFEGNLLHLNMNKSGSANANDTRNYIILTIGIFIGLLGVYFRFLGDSFFYTSVSNVILIIGIIVSLRMVFTILK